MDLLYLNSMNYVNKSISGFLNKKLLIFPIYFPIFAYKKVQGYCFLSLNFLTLRLFINYIFSKSVNIFLDVNELMHFKNCLVETSVY